MPGLVLSHTPPKWALAPSLGGGWIYEAAYDIRPDTLILAGAVPEPSTCALVGFGFLALLIQQRRPRSSNPARPAHSPEARRQTLAARQPPLGEKPEGPKAVAAAPSEARLVRRIEAARRLSCSLRTIDNLAASGVLQRRRLPGRLRASGFLASDLDALIVSGLACSANDCLSRLVNSSAYEAPG